MALQNRLVFSFPKQLQIWIYVFLVGDHRYGLLEYSYGILGLKCCILIDDTFGDNMIKYNMY